MMRRIKVESRCWDLNKEVRMPLFLRAKKIAALTFALSLSNEAYTANGPTKDQNKRGSQSQAPVQRATISPQRPQAPLAQAPAPHAIVPQQRRAPIQQPRQQNIQPNITEQQPRVDTQGTIKPRINNENLRERRPNIHTEELPIAAFVKRESPKTQKQYQHRDERFGGERFESRKHEFMRNGFHSYGYRPAYFVRDPLLYKWLRHWKHRRYRWAWERPIGWYRCYSYYFRPYPIYVTSYQWVTDYIFADSFEAQYEELDAASQEAYATEIPQEEPLSPVIKNRISRQVEVSINEQEQIAQSDNEDASINDFDSIINQRDYVYVLTRNSPNYSVTVVGTKKTCTLRKGDLLTMPKTPENAPSFFTMQVLKSTQRDRSCEAGDLVRISSDDLRELVNGFHEGVNRAVKRLDQSEKDNFEEIEK